MVVESHFIKEGMKQVEIEEYLSDKFGKAGYSHIDIQRTPLGTRIVVYANRPGLVIGRSGRTIRAITEEIKEKFELENPMLDVKEVENPFLDAKVVATRIARSIERGTFYKKVVGFYLSKIMESGAVGVQIKVSGKLGGQRGRIMKFKDGYIKHAGYYADNILDKGHAKAIVKLGAIGVEVKIMKDMPEDLSLKISELDEKLSEIPDFVVSEKRDEEPKEKEKDEKEERTKEKKKKPKEKEKNIKEESDYEKILDNTIPDTKKKIKKLKEPDYQELLEMEKKNKDRKGMKSYLKDKIEESKETKKKVKKSKKKTKKSKKKSTKKKAKKPKKPKKKSKKTKK